MLPLRDLAIKKALENAWQEAYLINEKILEEAPCDIDALNRLGFALIKLGKFKEAKRTYKKVTEIDKTNPIALKNLSKIDSILKQDIKDYQERNQNINKLSENLFIEEAGKTKIVELKNITDKKNLSFLEPGDCVCMIIKRYKIFIQSNNRYIGVLPDSIAMRLIRFIKGGNEYDVFIKSINDKSVTVFLKEIKKSKKFKNQPSFSSSRFIPQGFEGIDLERND